MTFHSGSSEEQSRAAEKCAGHTPGPWTLHASDMGGLSSLVYPEGVDYPVASVTGYFAKTGQTLPNARLIAAAPELLKALTSFVYEFGDKTNSATVNKARAAIAKATGAA